MLTADDRARRRAIEAWGGRFDGSSWMLLIEASVPLEEVALVVTCPEAVADASEGKPSAFHMILHETAHGPVLHVVLGLFDQPDHLYAMDLMVNPTREASYDMLMRLAQQDTLQMVFHDPHTGRGLRRRVVPFSTEHQAGVRAICQHCRDAPSDPESWKAAVAAIEPYRF